MARQFDPFLFDELAGRISHLLLKKMGESVHGEPRLRRQCGARKWLPEVPLNEFQGLFDSCIEPGITRGRQRARAIEQKLLESVHRADFGMATGGAGETMSRAQSIAQPQPEGAIRNGQVEKSRSGGRPLQQIGPFRPCVKVEPEKFPTSPRIDQAVILRHSRRVKSDVSTMHDPLVSIRQQTPCTGKREKEQPIIRACTAYDVVLAPAVEIAGQHPGVGWGRRRPGGMRHSTIL